MTVEQGPGIVVWPRSDMIRWAHPEDERSAEAQWIEAIPFTDAVEKRWDTDAHAAGYRIYEDDGELGPEQPPLRNASLGALEDLDASVLMYYIFVDLDLEPHAPWEGGLSEARDVGEDILTEFGGEGHQVLYRAGAYSTTSGLRLVFRPALPIPAPSYKTVMGNPAYRDRKGRFHPARGFLGLLWKELHESLEEYNLKIDKTGNEWTRCFRLPHVIRDGSLTQSWLDFSGLAEMDFGPWLSADTTTRLWRSEPVSNPVDAGGRPRGADLLTCTWTDAHYVGSGLQKPLATRSPGLYMAIKTGRPWYGVGERNEECFKAIALLAELLRETDPTQLYGASYRSVAAGAERTGTTDLEASLDELWGMCCARAGVEVARAHEREEVRLEVNGLGADKTGAGDQSDQTIGPWRQPPYPSADKVPTALATGPMGSGKSHQAAARIQGDSRVRPERPVVVVPTRALARDAARRFGLPCYLDLPKGTISLADSGVVVCIPSLRRVVLDPASPPDLVVIEEFEGVMRVLHTPGIMRGWGNIQLANGKVRRRRMQTSGAVWTHLTELCGACWSAGGQVLALDATANTERTIPDLAALTGLQPEVLAAPDKARTCWTGMTEEALSDRVEAISGLSGALDAGRRVLCFVSSSALARDLEWLAREDGITVIALTADAPPDVRTTVDDPNRLWEPYQLVLYTTAAGSGVDYDLDDRDVYIIADFVPGLGFDSVLQAAGRCRHPRSITSWIDPRRMPAPAPVEELHEKHREQLARRGPYRDPGGRHEHEHFESAVRDDLVRQLRCVAVRDDYYAARRHEYGVRVVEMDGGLGEEERSEVVQELRRARAAREANDVRCVLAAETLDDHTAGRLAGADELTLEERYQLWRHTTLRRWGYLNARLAHDTACKGGRAYRRACQLVDVAQVSVGAAEHLTTRGRRELDGPDGRVYPGQAEHPGSRAEELVFALQAAGLGPGIETLSRTLLAGPLNRSRVWVDRAPLDVETPAAAFDATWIGRDSLRARGFEEAIRARIDAGVDYRILGIPAPPENIDTRAMGWLGQLLGFIGLCTERDSEGNPVIRREWPGVIDPTTGREAPEAEAAKAAGDAAKRAWRRESKEARAKGLPPPKGPSKLSWRRLDVARLAKAIRLAERRAWQALSRRVPTPIQLVAEIAQYTEALGSGATAAGDPAPSRAVGNKPAHDQLNRAQALVAQPEARDGRRGHPSHSPVPSIAAIPSTAELRAARIARLARDDDKEGREDIA